MWRAELRGNDRGRVSFLSSPFFLIQVEGAAQECSSGSESRHPDGRQMLENISEQHVHFSRGGSSKYTQTLPQSLHTRGDREEEFFFLFSVMSSQTTVKTPDQPKPGAKSGNSCGALSLNRMRLIRR